MKLRKILNEILNESNLDKKVPGMLFKGSTYKEFVDKIISQILPTFGKPIVFTPSTNNLMDMGEIRFGQSNIQELKKEFETLKNSGDFRIQISDGGRKFKTQLPIEAVEYLLSKV